MQTELTVRATSSSGIQFVLKAGTAAIDLSAVGTVQLWRKDRSGGTVMTDNLTGTLSVNGAAGGSVKWTPGTAELVSGSAPYQAYFKIFESATGWYFVPESYDFTIQVRETY